MKEILDKVIPQKPHILDARVWAENLNNMPPDLALEKLEEVKNYWVMLNEKNIEQIKKL